MEATDGSERLTITRTTRIMYRSPPKRNAERKKTRLKYYGCACSMYSLQRWGEKGWSRSRGWPPATEALGGLGESILRGFLNCFKVSTHQKVEKVFCSLVNSMALGKDAAALNDKDKTTLNLEPKKNPFVIVSHLMRFWWVQIVPVFRVGRCRESLLHRRWLIFPFSLAPITPQLRQLQTHPSSPRSGRAHINK